MRRPSHIFGFISLAFIIGGLSFFFLRGFSSPNVSVVAGSRDHSIVLTFQGFSPSMITIHQGDTVTFSSSLASPFWPASDLHPSHLIYPEFDPKQPIESGQTWRFRFDKAGKWNFHDHLAPLFRGIIVVEGEGTVSIGENKDVNIGECSGTVNGSPLAGKEKCWGVAIEGALKQSGVDGAFDAISRLYAEYPDFAESCHGFTHLVGEEAYVIFRSKGSLHLTQKASSCGFGFYHGFMETLLFSGGTMEDAHKFCTGLDADRNLTGSAKTTACFHGIGHGTVDGSDPRTWGNADAMIAPSIVLCERVGKTDFEIDNCISGVFNSLANLAGDPKYRLSFDPENPYALCRHQTKPYVKKPCYEELNTLVYSRSGNNLVKAMNIAFRIPEKKYAKFAVSSLAVYAMKFAHTGREYANAVEQYAKLEQIFRASYLEGIIGGIFEFGPPGKEYEFVLTACAAPQISSDDRDACYRRAAWLSQNKYESSQYKKVCALIRSAYHDVCGNLIQETAQPTN